MSKPTCKAEKHPWQAINKEVSHLSPLEIQYYDNDKTYAKLLANRARRRDGKVRREALDNNRDSEHM